MSSLGRVGREGPSLRFREVVELLPRQGIHLLSAKTHAILPIPCLTIRAIIPREFCRNFGKRTVEKQWEAVGRGPESVSASGNACFPGIGVRKIVGRKTMRIGVPTETSPGEHRVAATPETVKKLVCSRAQNIAAIWGRCGSTNSRRRLCWRRC